MTTCFVCVSSYIQIVCVAFYLNQPKQTSTTISELSEGASF